MEWLAIKNWLSRDGAAVLFYPTRETAKRGEMSPRVVRVSRTTINPEAKKISR